MTNDTVPSTGGSVILRHELYQRIRKVIKRYSIGVMGAAAVVPSEPWSIDNLAMWMLDASVAYRIEIGLMLAQATVECHFGVDPQAVRSRRTKNIFNVGNVDSGADEQQKTWEAGIIRYARVMHSEYLWAGEGETVTMEMMVEHDFRRPRGGRYATAPNYTQMVKNTYDRIQLILA